MIKKEIYPKTKRLGIIGKISITEKVDGSNLCIFKLNGRLYIAQRSTIYEFGELESGMMYKGLYGWLEQYNEWLKDNLNEGSVLCGEWIGMGKLKYDFEQKFLMFAKANINEDFTLKNINYTREYFIYPFVDKQIPYFISAVPLVYEGDNTEYLFKSNLDRLYEDYTQQVNRNVEGFVVNYSNSITKYVRMKNGKLEEHYANGEGE